MPFRLELLCAANELQRRYLRPLTNSYATAAMKAQMAKAAKAMKAMRAKATKAKARPKKAMKALKALKTMKATRKVLHDEGAGGATGAGSAGDVGATGAGGLETAKPVKQEQVHRQWKAGDLRMNGPAGNLEIAEHAYVEGCCWSQSFCQNNCNTRRLINKRNYTLPQEVIKIDEMSRHDFFDPKLQPLHKIF